MQVAGPGADMLMDRPFPEGSGAFTYPEIFVNAVGESAIAYERVERGVLDLSEFTRKHANLTIIFPPSTAAFIVPLTSIESRYFFAGSTCTYAYCPSPLTESRTHFKWSEEFEFDQAVLSTSQATVANPST